MLRRHQSCSRACQRWYWCCEDHLTDLKSHCTRQMLDGQFSFDFGWLRAVSLLQIGCSSIESGQWSSLRACSFWSCWPYACSDKLEPAGQPAGWLLVGWLLKVSFGCFVLLRVWLSLSRLDGLLGKRLQIPTGPSFRHLLLLGCKVPADFSSMPCHPLRLRRNPFLEIVELDALRDNSNC